MIGKAYCGQLQVGYVGGPDFYIHTPRKTLINSFSQINKLLSSVCVRPTQQTYFL